MSCSLYLPKWHEVLAQLYKTPDKYRYSQKLNIGIRGSLTHLRHVVRLLEANKLVEIIPTKKIKRIHLTEKGKNVAKAILEIKSEITYEAL